MIGTMAECPCERVFIGLLQVPSDHVEIAGSGVAKMEVTAKSELADTFACRLGPSDFRKQRTGATGFEQFGVGFADVRHGDVPGLGVPGGRSVEGGGCHQSAPSSAKE